MIHDMTANRELIRQIRNEERLWKAMGIQPRETVAGLDEKAFIERLSKYSGKANVQLCELFERVRQEERARIDASSAKDGSI